MVLRMNKYPPGMSSAQSAPNFSAPSQGLYGSPPLFQSAQAKIEPILLPGQRRCRFLRADSIVPQ